MNPQTLIFLFLQSNKEFPAVDAAADQDPEDFEEKELSEGNYIIQSPGLEDARKAIGPVSTLSLSGDVGGQGTVTDHNELVVSLRKGSTESSGGFEPL